MGQATRTTKLALDLGTRSEGGVNQGKRAYLDTTIQVLNEARAFYIDFFLAHAGKLAERVPYYSEKHQEQRERAISADELLTWAEYCTVATDDHPCPWTGWNFSERFPEMPNRYRRSVIKDTIGRVRSYLSNRANWQKTGKKKGQPGLPGANNHPALYGGTYSLELGQLDLRESFLRLKVYTGERWVWANYPVKYNRYFEQRRNEPGWQSVSPKLVLRPKSAELHFTQTKEIKAKKVVESKRDPDLVTVAVDLNVKMLAVITVRCRGKIIQTKFVRDHGLDQHRYQHMKHISKRQWQSGKPVKGERNCRHLWAHVRQTNLDVAHTVARTIADICAQYPGCVLIFERLRVMKRGKGSNKSHRLNRKLANQIRGMICDFAKEKAFATSSTVTVETNAHGTSQYCSRCGEKGERFSLKAGRRMVHKGGKLFRCKHCGLDGVHADWNASVNVHHSFYQEFHWQLRRKRSA